MMNAPSVPEITAADLKERLDRGDPLVLVDVREPFEAQIADLPDYGQKRIPTGDFPQRFSELDPGSEIVVYCRSGSRSAWACAILAHQGYEHVLNLHGGVLGWREAVDPSLAAY
jgi:adenylyltransferase/sulfurtransferase